MCGILGSPRITPDVRSMLPFVALEMQSRGTHAWGASNGHEVLRHLGPLVKTWHSEQARMADWTSAIIHTRAASVGSPDLIENAHPFVETRDDGTQVIGIHNGGIHNHSELNTKHGRQCAVDSMHLWKHRAADLSWEELRGSAAVGWYETPPALPDGTLAPPAQRIARMNSQSLHCVEVGDGGVIWASTASALLSAALMVGSEIKRNWAIEEDLIYVFDQETGELLRSEERCPFGRVPVTTYTPATAASGGHWDGRMWTGHGYTSGVDRTTDRRLYQVGDTGVVGVGGEQRALAPAAGGETVRGIDVCWQCRGALARPLSDLLCLSCFTRCIKDYKEHKKILKAVESGDFTQEEALDAFVG